MDTTPALEPPRYRRIFLILGACWATWVTAIAASSAAGDLWIVALMMFGTPMLTLPMLIIPSCLLIRDLEREEPKKRFRSALAVLAVPLPWTLAFVVFAFSPLGPDHVVISTAAVLLFSSFPLCALARYAAGCRPARDFRLALLWTLLVIVQAWAAGFAVLALAYLPR